MGLFLLAVHLLVVGFRRRSELVQDCLSALLQLLPEGTLLLFQGACAFAHLLSKGTLFFVQGAHTVSERFALLLRERAKTLALCSLRLSTAVIELAGSSVMRTRPASLPHGLPAVVHGPWLMSPRLPLEALGSIHTLALTSPRAAAFSPAPTGRGRFCTRRGGFRFLCRSIWSSGYEK